MPRISLSADVPAKRGLERWMLVCRTRERGGGVCGLKKCPSHLSGEDDCDANATRGGEVQRRWLLGAVVAMTITAAGCGGGEPGATDDNGARQAVESYVDALNSRDAKALMRIGGVPEDRRAKKEAQQILVEKGGRDLRIVDLKVDHDFGPDVGSAKLVADAKTGEDLRETVTVTRESGAWHVAIFADRPSNKSASATDEPT
ncbi:hypothetical protein [Streptomyces sp. NPDC057438]|uniref:hypothetical protein n=1 Tax=Streptomyces sp. NPDC057438 TaxID=3346133 RepID=UPI00369D1280